MKPGWRWMVLPALALAAVLGWSRLQWNADVLDTLPKEVPAVRGLQLQQRHFAASEELIIRLRAGAAEDALSAARQLAGHLRGQTSLVAAAWWQSPLEEDPSQLAALVAEAWLNAPPDQVNRLEAQFSLPQLLATLDAARGRLATSLTPAEMARLSYDPLGLTDILGPATPGQDNDAPSWLVYESFDGRSRFVRVNPRAALGSYRECRDWLRHIQASVAWWQNHHGVAGLELAWSGRPAFMTEIGGGMERDLSGPALGTLGIIALLFYLAHRAWRPLAWLLILLVANFMATLGLGGLLLGSLNMVNLGFAAMLVGLAVDYALVLWQEAQAHPELPLSEVQRRTRSGIDWSALTTAGAFLLLHFSGLPGLGQLGTLVALGVLMAAALMVQAFLWPLAPCRRQNARTEPAGPFLGKRRSPAVWRWGAVLLMLAALGLLFHRGLPAVDWTTEALRPKNSAAYAVWDEVKAASGLTNEPLLLLLSAPDAEKLAGVAAECHKRLETMAGAGGVRGFLLPVALVPHPRHRSANLEVVRRLADRRETVVTAASQAGFTSNALALTLQVLAYWRQAPQESAGQVPGAFRWLRERCYTVADGRHWLLGVVQPAGPTEGLLTAFQLPATAGVEVYLTNWEVVGRQLARRTLGKLPWLLSAMIFFLILALRLAIRSWRLVGLSLLALGGAVMLLLAWMRLAGWHWNLMNVLALPLILGLGVDYCLHVLLGLRRCQGDWGAAYLSVGKALLLAGSTTAIAFASLHFSSNAGLASLGQVTAAGVLCCMFMGVLVLPHWAGGKPRQADGQGATAARAGRGLG